MEQFASGWKRNYYGKGDVLVYRLSRDGKSPDSMFGANIKMLVYGEAFWPTYTTGDNTGLIATDSMKNFIQRETLNYPGNSLEDCCRYLASRFQDTYPQVEGVQVSAIEVPYGALGDRVGFAPAGPERATARVEIGRGGFLEVTSGITGFKLLRLGGSAFAGFVRDQYTTLPETKNRPLHMWLDLEWLYSDSTAAFEGGATSQVRGIVHQVFGSFESGSIQQVIYQTGQRVLEQVPAISEIHLEANNRTWDMVVDGEDIAMYTEPRPAYGCLGLRLRR
jgi:urate oxidase / 2-oxo-4-hydroxy-4-carboxy-5-ureidoimidazoline decarboxylase